MPESAARLFGLAPGVPYAEALVDGLARRLPPEDPTAWARVTIFANSGRMRRRIREVLDAGPPRLLPHLRTIGDLGQDPGFEDVPPALPKLHLRLDLAELILALIERSPDLAPRAAAFGLAETLADLLDEMHGQGVGVEALAALDVGAFAEHWRQGRAIVEAAFDHFGKDPQWLAGPEARLRQVVETLTRHWETDPPADPVVIAGSTGSRGPSRMLIEAVARLPHGYVVLPGYDFQQPHHVWSTLDGAMQGEDHPQYRFRPMMRALGLTPAQIAEWSDMPAPAPERNRLISLALRPAPVTDQWRREGRALTGVAEATSGATLIEAPSQRMEAAAVALRLRQAVADGQTAALITPDRVLTRRVAAALQRWGIEPDDSAGEPLHQSAPGRFLRQANELRISPPDLPALLALLKHPITSSADGVRGPHLRWTRELELYLRRHATARPGGADFLAWAAKTRVDDGRRGWAEWLAHLLDSIAHGTANDLGSHIAEHLALAEALAMGPGGREGESDGAGRLWSGRAGEAARAAMEELAGAGARGGALAARDYASILSSHLGAVPVQDPNRPHPGVMIWGTLEARVQSADLTILAGLNDGTWPDLPGPDTWLNRQMREAAGLLLPDRRIGLAAHDFQMAAAAREVVLSRALRNEEAETVPSRWLNRLVNLLDGIGAESKAALAEMRGRGQCWLSLAADLDRPEARVPPAPRPSPRPPVSARPRELAVTRITQLIRDPYAIYARHILRLRPLDPVAPSPDARLRGTALHRVMEEFLAARAEWHGNMEVALTRLSDIAWEVLGEATPLPSMQSLWHARLMSVADRIVAGEIARLDAGTPVLIEDWGRVDLAGLDFRLTARPDRIDRLNDGRFVIYDYKSGKPPSDSEVKHFEKQLPLEGAMLERDGFAGLGKQVLDGLGYIGLGAAGGDRMLPMEDDTGRLPDVTWEGLHGLIGRYSKRQQGYTAIRAAQLTSFAGDFDHLARFGEWDLTDAPTPETVGPAKENAS
ncbi:double-strand break repair protein AddB [Tropicimonas marinistellae]|uniref:double-strand break repair protein AddB n=1 Tax=Tropicimonas marinistellae TaxID=1739787 RepID=UPI00082A50BE|nr:double-strand break repair protein AddB [Tropicimonas marinistellae]